MCCLHFIKMGGLPASEGAVTGSRPRSRSRSRSGSGSSDESLHSKYAIALKTKSFDEFSMEVQRAINHPSPGNGNGDGHVNGIICRNLVGDEGYVNTQMKKAEAEAHTLLVSCYFSTTQNAFELCALLLRSTYDARMSYMPIYRVLDLTPDFHHFNQQQCHRISAHFMLFVEQQNPFMQAARFEGMCECLEELRRKLELSRQNKVKMGWVAHKMFPQLRKQIAELDAGGRGIFVLKTHLETTRLLVSRLYNQVEHHKRIMRICHGRKYQLYPLQQVLTLLGKSDANFRRRLDEIEEQACLCLFNINRARTLLLRQIQIRH